ncbi:MAG: DinB family protein [Nocardioidaceae bacterium]
MPDAAAVSREMEALLRQLEAQRRHVLAILDGLTEEQLRRPVLPSGWHCLGLVKHLALSDERYWFRCVVAGEPLDYFPEGPNADWQVSHDESAEHILELYRDEIRRANAVIATTGADEPPRQPDPEWASWGMDFPDLRSVMLHVITETAVHAGHLDAVRELIDGRQWVVL